MLRETEIDRVNFIPQHCYYSEVPNRNYQEHKSNKHKRVKWCITNEMKKEKNAQVSVAWGLLVVGARCDAAQGSRHWIGLDQVALF